MLRIGTGYDIHTLTEGRQLVLGGVVVPFSKGESGHSDGDVLLHALIDALLGASALGDIGTHFPPSDPAYKDIKSALLLKKTILLISQAGYGLVNMDSIIILEEPRISPYIYRIRENISSLLSTSLDRISVKAKTKEKQDSAGRGESVEAFCSVLLEKL